MMLPLGATETRRERRPSGGRGGGVTTGACLTHMAAELGWGGVGSPAASFRSSRSGDVPTGVAPRDGNGPARPGRVRSRGRRNGSDQGQGDSGDERAEHLLRCAWVHDGFLCNGRFGRLERPRPLWAPAGVQDHRSRSRVVALQVCAISDAHVPSYWDNRPKSDRNRCSPAPGAPGACGRHAQVRGAASCIRRHPSKPRFPVRTRSYPGGMDERGRRALKALAFVLAWAVVAAPVSRAGLPQQLPHRRAGHPRGGRPPHGRRLGHAATSDRSCPASATPRAARWAPTSSSGRRRRRRTTSSSSATRSSPASREPDRQGVDTIAEAGGGRPSPGGAVRAGRCRRVWLLLGARRRDELAARPARPPPGPSPCGAAALGLVPSPTRPGSTPRRPASR